MTTSRLFLPVLFSGTLALASTLPAAAGGAGDELLSALQGRLEAREGVDDLVATLDDLMPAELRQLEGELERAWPGQREGYLAAFTTAARQHFGQSAAGHNKQEVSTLRGEFLRIRNMGEDAMKKPLREKSWPAMARLRALLLPSPQDVLAKGGADLANRRSRLLLLARFRNGLLEVRVSLAPPYGPQELAAAEAGIMTGFSGLAREGQRVLEKNAETAAKEELPAAEVRGVRELNEMRLLVGLPALALDPKLCQASRNHSRDMAEKGFFSHTSPVAGKETPSQRAARAGTSGSGENIFMGSPRAAAANRGWFFSPGHHKNMFREGYRRVGLGQHGRHWTQMFGR